MDVNFECVVTEEIIINVNSSLSIYLRFYQRVS